MSSILEQLLSNPTPSSTHCHPGDSASPNASFSFFQALGVEASSGNGIIGLLLSIALLVIRSNWAKLAILGGAFESFRRGTSWLYIKFWEAIFLNVYFQEDDPTFDWMMVWLSKQPGWSQARDIEVNSDEFGDMGATVELDTEDDKSDASKPTRKLAYLPSFSTTYSIWYKKRFVQVTRTQSESGRYGSKEITLQLSIMSRSNRLLVEILQEARQIYSDAQQHSVSVYIADTSNSWRCVASRPKRSLRSVVLDEGVQDDLLEDARDFLASKSWYADRGIPFRRGYLLYGAPGSGKTSLIHSLAGELGLNVYIVSLSRAGLDDSALSELLNDLPERCIALMEDIDAAFTHSLSNRGGDSDEPPSSSLDDNEPKEKEKEKSDSANRTQSRLSLSGLLNALDGVGAQEGRILFATTNHVDALDPALRRPGRMDWHIEFKLASQYQAGELFKRFYVPSKDESSSSKPSAQDANDKEKQEQDQAIGKSVRGIHRIPKIPMEEMEKLAKEFSECVPNRRMSMAALQGYLMTYKTRPVQAVVNVKAWVQRELTKKEKVVVKI